MIHDYLLSDLATNDLNLMNVAVINEMIMIGLQNIQLKLTMANN